MSASQHLPTGAERRRHVRFPTGDRLLGTLIEHELPVRVRDVGAGGFSVETVEPLSPGEVTHVRFTAFDDWTALVEARSLYCRPSVSADGLPRFVTGYAYVAGRAPADVIAALVQKVTSIAMD